MTTCLKKCFTATLLCMLAGCASAESIQPSPPGWPWRGVLMGGGNLPWTWNGYPPASGSKISPGDVDHYAQMGVNAVAIAFNPRQAVNVSQILSVQRKIDMKITPDQAIEADLAMADALLDACKKDGIVGIITQSQFPLDPNLGITQTSPGFWDDPAQLAETLRRIGQIAQHFANRGDELGAYDFLTEPLLRLPSGAVQTPPQWASFREAIIHEIRKYDHRHYIVLSAGFGGEPSAFKIATPVRDDKVIYSFHMYDPHSFTHQAIYSGTVGLSYPQANDPILNKQGLAKLIQPVVEFQHHYNAYIYVGEFSAVRWAPGALQYLTDVIDILDRNHFGWVYFAPGGWNGWDPSFDTRFYPNALGFNDPKHYVGGDTPRWQLLKHAWGQNKASD